MTARRVVLILILLSGVAAVAYYAINRPGPSVLVLTGIVTTDDIIVSPEIAGRIEAVHVKEGESVSRKQLLAEMQPDLLQTEQAFYARGAEASAFQVRQNEAALRYEQQRAEHQVEAAQANLAAAVAQEGEAQAALENARATFRRQEQLAGEGVTPPQQLDEARTAYEGAQARLETVQKEIAAQRAAVGLAKAEVEQVAARRSQLLASQQQQAAAEAQQAGANVRLGYTRIEAPVDGIVDVVASRAGEVIAAGEPILTLINPDNLWVRVDVEETYIARVRSGDTLTVRLPSGEERQGIVYYRSADAGFATQRDVSRTKRDIRTFEIRLRVDNSDRRLALGMTVYVLFPLPQQ
jgi:HlyD family secretion protein